MLSDPPRLFRTLVISSTAAYLIWFFHLLLVGSLISTATWDILSWVGHGALLPMPPSFAWLWMLLSVAVTVGLCAFSKSARLVFALLTLFSALITLLSGLQVETAFGSFCLFIANLADGGILLMAYTSPLKERFA